MFAGGGRHQGIGGLTRNPCSLLISEAKATATATAAQPPPAHASGDEDIFDDAGKDYVCDLETPKTDGNGKSAPPSVPAPLKMLFRLCPHLSTTPPRTFPAEPLEPTLTQRTRWMTSLLCRYAGV